MHIRDEVHPQPVSKRPSRKVAVSTAGGVGIAGPLAIVLRWGLAEAGIEMPVDVAMALAGVLVAVVQGVIAYMVRD